MTKEQNDMDKPHMVTSHDIHLDEDYAKWIAELKHRYRSAQVKAAVKVNAEKLLFNWQLGRDLVKKKAEERWGAGVVEQVSLDMQKEFPNETGFSTTNLWYMKKWYLFYFEDASTTILQQAVAELQSATNLIDTKLHQLGGELAIAKLHQAGAEMSDEKLYHFGRELYETRLCQTGKEYVPVNWCRHLRQHPNQGCSAYSGTTA